MATRLSSYPGIAGRRNNKYGNKRTEVDGILFDSAAEAARYSVLKILVRTGHISNLERQKSFDLVVNDILIARYRCDFTYDDARTGEHIVEDVKSAATITPVYKLKRSLMRALHGITISEVT